MNSPAPYVSVLMITFNHERCIARAIDSVLEQETAFPFELVIGEDCSTDGTRAVIEDYVRRYPGKIRPLFRDHNLGCCPNFIETLRACRGRYVAWLDGDDYWIPRDKLARQAAFLDANLDYAICSGRARVFHEDGSQQPWDYPDWTRTEFTVDDLLRENFIPTCSVMFRHGLLLEIPQWLERMPFTDWPLFISLSRLGDIHVIPEALAAHRVHSKGVWNQQTPEQMAEARREFYRQLAAGLPELAEQIAKTEPRQ